MDNLAREHVPGKPELEYGRIIKEGDLLSVTVSFGTIEAVRAASCLLCPKTGDTVLLSVSTHGKAWVLAVLERTAATPSSIELQGDSILRVNGGSLTVAPDTELNCITGKAALHAEDAEITATRVGLTAELFQSQVERVKTVAGVVDDISREFTRRVISYFRFTKEHEECQAQSRRQLVDETMTMHSKNAVIVSEEETKIDGELIHMG